MTTVKEMPETIEERASVAPPEMPPPKALVSCHSVCGLREVNQDVAAVQQMKWQNEPTTFVLSVADGMGGHLGGDVAAPTGTQALHTAMVPLAILPPGQDVVREIPDWIWRGVNFANQWIMNRAKDLEAENNMGTTLVTAVLQDSTLYVANVGDSRGYRYRGGQLEQLTRDDSPVQAFVDSGELTPEQAERHPRANEITKALGWPDALNAMDVDVHSAMAGDLVMLCSDGLWKGAGIAIRDALDALSREPFTQASLDNAAEEMVMDALRRGSDDNVSVALLWIEPESAREPVIPKPNEKEE